MKHRLYYQDPYIKNFQAIVTKKGIDEDGTPFVVLDNTGFYPTGGGQPSDTGRLNHHLVTHVEDVDGEIRHYLEHPIPESETKVDGHIDWDRRFDNMQQHAGQHILSAAFAEIFNFQTVSFHLGKEIVTIDLAVSQLRAHEIEKAQARANDIVMGNLPIQTKWVDEGELTNYPLRKPPKVKENIRLVIIEDIDYNACGGTHPARTGEVGPIQILGTERLKDKIRVTFMCGYRVVQAFTKKHGILQQLSHVLMRPEEEVIASVEQLLIEQKALKQELEDVKKAVLKNEAAQLLNKAQQVHGDKLLVSQFFIDRSINELQQITHFIKDEEPCALIIFTMMSGEKVQFIAARGGAIDLNMNTVIKDILPLINGRGGGNNDLVQGGGEAKMTASALLEHLKEAIVGKEPIS